MATFNVSKIVSALPNTLVADTMYLVRVGAGYDQYVTNSTGTIVAYRMNTGSGINSTALDGLTGTADTVPYFTGEGTMSLALYTNFGRQLSASADATGTKTLLALENVSNTSDANKPISTAAQTALDLKVDKISGKGLSTNDFTTAQQTVLNTLTAVGNTTMAAAGTMAIGAATTQTITVTGNTAITAFDTALPGVTRTLRGSGTGALRKLTYNATSMILPFGVDFFLPDATAITMVSLGSGNWAAASYVSASPTSFTGGTLTSALNEAPQVTIGSAATVSIGAAAANTVHVNGTTTISSFGTAATAGTRRTVRFLSAMTLVHSSSLILPGAANITTAVNDVAEFTFQANNAWTCNYYARAGFETQAALALKENAITGTNSAQYFRGDKTFADFATNVRASVLTGVVTTNTITAVTATDTILQATGKLQGQITQMGTVVAMPAANMDYAAGSYFTKTITVAQTFTVTNPAPTGTCTSIMLELTNGGLATVTWMSGITWAGGIAPTLSAAGVDVIGLYSFNGGTTWRGALVAKDIR